MRTSGSAAFSAGTASTPFTPGRWLSSRIRSGAAPRRVVVPGRVASVAYHCELAAVREDGGKPAPEQRVVVNHQNAHGFTVGPADDGEAAVFIAQSVAHGRDQATILAAITLASESAAPFSCRQRGLCPAATADSARASAGSVSTTDEPWLGVENTSSVPPIRSARSAMMRMPTWVSSSLPSPG